jgi:methyl-accepting chemotaxis protein
VNSAVHEQEIGAKQVNESLRVINEITGKVSEGSKGLTEGNASMIKEVDSLQGSAGEITTNMEEMSGGISSINIGAKEVTDLADTVHSSIRRISAIADGFEV